MTNTAAADIVDAQFHLFHTMDAATCLQVMDALGISGVVIDEVWSAESPTKGLEPSLRLETDIQRPLALGARMAAMRHPNRFRYLLRLDHRDPQMEAVMREAARDPLCAAFRGLCWNHHNADLREGRFVRMFELAAELGRPLFFQTFETASVKPMLAAVPEARVVLDHVGLARTREAFDDLLRMSEIPNLALKWCHADLLFPGEAYPFPARQAGLRDAVAAFGPDRVMWASDASMLGLDTNWAETLYCVRGSELLSSEAREWVLGGTARRILGWKGVE
jgi:predicted TIM-barrel fold metal-dependent hydrolase